jgi:hypothetical protein
MKILYSIDSQNHTDYFNNTLFHGLNLLENVEIIDIPRIDHIYSDTTNPRFSIQGILNNDTTESRADVDKKIKTDYYDIIIVSVLGRAYRSPLFHKILENYNPKKLIFVDSQDSTNVYHYLKNKGLYFKKELVIDDPKIFPIGFSFPKEKIQTPLEKTQVISNLFSIWEDIPTNLTETEYYNDFRKSLFAKTTKDKGWDKLRHYEILGCRSLPFFVNLLHCPKNTCTHLPKDILLDILNMIYSKGMDYFMTNEGLEVYHELENKIHNHFMEHCTTEAMAKYMLDCYLKYYNH